MILRYYHCNDDIMLKTVVSNSFDAVGKVCSQDPHSRNFIGKSSEGFPS